MTLGLGESIPGVVGKKGTSTSVMRPPNSDALISADRSASFSQAATELRSFTAFLCGDDRRDVLVDAEAFSFRFSPWLEGYRERPNVEHGGWRKVRDGVCGGCWLKFTGRSLGIAGVGAVGEAIAASINSTSPASRLSQLVPSEITLRDLSAKLLVVWVPIVGVFSEEPFEILDLLLEDTGEPFKAEPREGLGLSRPLFEPR